jgi:peptidoglycan-N-acetylglucosamine deacetylase
MRPCVTLTFDNGPTPQVTAGVLDCLTRHDVKSTFFPIGTKAAKPSGAALLHRVHDEGHWIGNHTFTHGTPLGELDAASAVREVQRAEEVLSWVVQPQHLFRPFGGAGRIGRHLLHPAAVEMLVVGKYTCVLWNCVPGDWRDPEGWLDRAIAHCLSHAWSLVVLHDTATGAMVYLDRFLQHLTAKAGTL